MKSYDFMTISIFGQNTFLEDFLISNTNKKVQSTIYGVGRHWRISRHENGHILQASTMAMFHFGFVLKR